MHVSVNYVTGRGRNKGHQSNLKSDVTKLYHGTKDHISV